MGTALLIKDYILWHYGTALKEILELEVNFLRFGYNFFSIPVLWKTLFAPFYRIQESYKNWSSFETLFENIVANAVSRAVGFIMRIFMIAVGLTFETILLLLLIPAYVCWILLPIIVPALLVAGFTLLF